MKNRKLLLLTALLLLAALALISCQGNTETGSATGSASESASESVSESVSGTESGTGEPETLTETASESASETESETVPVAEVPRFESCTPDTVCYALTYEASPTGRTREVRTYYLTLSDAVADHPEGADLFLCHRPDTLEVTFPEGVNYSLHTAQFSDLDLRVLGNGAIYDYPEIFLHEFAYFTSFDYLVSYFSDPEYAIFRLPLERRYVWLLSEEEGMRPGQYFVEKGEGGFTFSFFAEPERFGDPFVCRAADVYYYSLADALANRTNNTNIHIVNEGVEPEVIPLQSGGYLRIAYDWYDFRVHFAGGVTFDDGLDPAGYCYYNELNFTLNDGTIGGYAWIWSDAWGLEPGKFLISRRDDSLEEAWDEDTENFTVFHMGNYTLIWQAPLTDFPLY